MPQRGPRRVFITGGSSGIGLALGAALVGEGAHVCICARGQQRLDEAVTVLEGRAPGSGPKPFGVALDVSDRGAVEAAAAGALDRLGGIDLLVNNAGIVHPGSFLELEADRFDAMMDVNYHGTVNVTRAFAPAMIEGGGGKIAIVSSLAGVVGIYGYTAYASSKFALRGFAECLRHDLMVHGVSVHTAFPPDTDTPQLAYENQHKPAQTKALGGSVKALSAAEVADSILRGIDRGKTIILPGTETKLVYWAARRFPGLTRRVTDSMLRKIEKSLPPG